VEGRPLEEAELVELAKRGDVRAYEELVERHRTLVYRTAYHITGSAADAEDAAQDAFVKAFFALRRFRSGAPFRPWILRIAANEARNRGRSARRRADLALRAAAALGDASAPSPEAAALADEERRALAAAVARLPQRDRLAIACRYFLELTEAETAEVLGVRRGTVKSRLSRALARLRAELAAPEPVEEAPRG
jgi:RNA polymerase sigma-70 factor (ECF subfamily)